MFLIPVGHQFRSFMFKTDVLTRNLVKCHQRFHLKGIANGKLPSNTLEVIAIAAIV